MYSTVGDGPKVVNLPVHAHIASRFPVPETFFVEHSVQPYVHDCDIYLRENGQQHQFRIFFKWHTRLAINKAIPTSEHLAARGDILVMRVGSRIKGNVINMRGRDVALSDRLVVL